MSNVKQATVKTLNKCLVINIEGENFYVNKSCVYSQSELNKTIKQTYYQNFIHTAENYTTIRFLKARLLNILLNFTEKCYTKAVNCIHKDIDDRIEYAANCDFFGDGLTIFDKVNKDIEEFSNIDIEELDEAQNKQK